jgi:putative DNA primase/helicase
VTFKPTHTLFLMSNYRPHIGNEQAMWDRVLLIGFEQRFVDNPKEGEYRADKELPEKLRADASGILAWLVRGAISYQEGGLKIPDKVRADTEKYREEDDFIARFVADCCVEAGNAKVKSSVIHSEYEKWAEKNKEPELTNQALSQELEKRGYRKKAMRHGKYFFGVGLESDYGSRMAAIEEEDGTEGIPF